MFNASCQGIAFFTSLAVRYAWSPDPFKNYKGHSIQAEYYFLDYRDLLEDAWK